MAHPERAPGMSRDRRPLRGRKKPPERRLARTPDPARGSPPPAGHSAAAQAFEPVKRTKVYAEIASQIYRLIEDGRLKPGDRLPPERELAEMFGVSRTSVRDAIRVLEMRGLVQPRHGEGTVIRQGPIDAIVGPLAEALVTTKDVAADLFDMRKLLEPPLARAAALRASDGDLEALRDIVARQADRVRAGESGIAEDTAFHYRIAAAAKNRVVLRVLDVIMDLLRETRSRSLECRGRPERSLDGHRRILDAIEARDPDAAAAAMRVHIEDIESLPALPAEHGARSRADAPGGARVMSRAGA